MHSGGTAIVKFVDETKNIPPRGFQTLRFVNYLNNNCYLRLLDILDGQLIENSQDSGRTVDMYRISILQAEQLPHLKYARSPLV